MTAEASGTRAEERGRRTDVLVAVAAGVGAVAGSYAVAGATPAFVGAPVASLVVAATPGVVVTFSILVLGTLGEQVAFGIGLATTVALFAVAAAVGRLVGDRLGAGAGTSVAAAGLLAASVGAALTGDLPSSLAAGVGTALVPAVATLVAGTDVAADPGRRRLLGSLAAAVGIGVVSYALGRGRASEPTRALDDVAESTPDPAAAGGTSTGVDEDESSMATESTPEPTATPAPAARQQLLADATENSLAVDGLEPLVSTRFYEIDVNKINPRPAVEEWTLTVTGAVDEERTYSYEELTGMPSEDRFVTLRCVGDPLDGRQLDNALWTGVPMADLLDASGAYGEYVMLRAADDFYEEMPVDALRPGLLAYGMNDEVLPRAHGFPARALVPGHWGEVNVKWLTEIDVLEEEATGYWEKRGWHGTGPVNTVAKLSTKGVREDDTAYVAGHAYAGTRGIDRVEVSIDGGSTWQAATLSEPLPGDDVWRQWRYGFQPEGSHEVVVRAIDGTGTLQPRERSDAFPSGATGWVRTTFEP